MISRYQYDIPNSEECSKNASMAKLKTSSNVGKPQTANKNKRRDRERSQKGDKELCTNDNSQAVTSPQTV